jgi:hypothetical protein
MTSRLFHRLPPLFSLPFVRKTLKGHFSPPTLLPLSHYYDYRLPSLFRTDKVSQALNGKREEKRKVCKTFVVKGAERRKMMRKKWQKQKKVKGNELSEIAWINHPMD